jgi:hypothetical protein
MSVPNCSKEVRELFNTGHFNLKTERGQGAFTDACVSMLNGLDPNWGHLIKKSGQTSVHDHGEDAALYKLPDNKAQAVDFIGGAGGPNPQPGWMVDEPRYTHADWFDPCDHGIREAAPPAPQPLRIPSYAELGDDAFFRAMVGVPLQTDMLASGQQLNDGSAVWIARTVYRLMAKLIARESFDPAAEVRDVRNQWRAILGQPPV